MHNPADKKALPSPAWIIPSLSGLTVVCNNLSSTPKQEILALWSERQADCSERSRTKSLRVYGAAFWQPGPKQSFGHLINRPPGDRGAGVRAFKLISFPSGHCKDSALGNLSSSYPFYFHEPNTFEYWYEETLPPGLNEEMLRLFKRDNPDGLLPAINH